LLGVACLVWPEITIGVFVILAGIYAIVLGVSRIVASFQIKNA
jgi:uncharacterized membrane protein HdeD (DUF308 family)